MYKVKKYVISLCIMMIVATVFLLIVSALTYMFKWQADKAVIGIIITYVLAGFAGGISLRKERKIIGALGLGTMFMLLLVICSRIGFQIPFEFSVRVIRIWLLITSSTFVGMCLKRR